MDKAKEEEKASKEFAAMEAAALKAYQEDLKRLGLESGKTTARHFKTNIPGRAEGPFLLVPHRSYILEIILVF